MPRIHLTAETMPKSSEEFQRILREAWENASPLDDLIQLTRDLVLLEQQYGMNSAQFYERFQRGELGDDLDYFDWAAKFEMYCQAKEEMERVLEVLDVYPLPVPA
jgi:hypothetical protein